MNFKRTIDVVTTTADYVETAKDIKDGKGITGFDVILDIVRMVFKAIAKVVKWLFRAIGWFWDPKNIDLSGVHEKKTPGGYYDDIDYNFDGSYVLNGDRYHKDGSYDASA